MIHEPLNGFAEVLHGLRRVATHSAGPFAYDTLECGSGIAQNAVLIGAQKFLFDERGVSVTVNVVTHADAHALFFRIDFGLDLDFRITDFGFQSLGAGLSFL